MFYRYIFIMNIEKQVTVSQLKAKYNKDFDNLGKMNPLIEFTVGKCIAQTEATQAVGKETSWKDSVVVSFLDQTHITVRSYDQDATEREYMGSSKLQIKSLRFPGGPIELNLTSDNGQTIGTLSGKYTIKNLNATPLLLAKNFKVEMVKENKLLTKARPCLQIQVDQESCIATESKDEVVGTSIAWNQCLRMRIKQTSKMTFSLVDKDDITSPIFCYECNAKQFRLQNGTKKFNFLDNNFNQLGQLYFDFQTMNLVMKEESVKNQEKEKQSDKEVTCINIQKMNVKLPKEDIDIYFKIIVGSNRIKSDTVEKSPKESEIPINASLYADSKENKLILVVLEKNLIKDQVIAAGNIGLDLVVNGENKIVLCNPDGKDQIGTAVICLNIKQVIHKTLLLDNISINVSEEDDFIGGNNPFVRACIGCCSGRTETGNNGKVAFKKGIQLKFFNQDTMNLQVWDEDIVSSSLLYTQEVCLSNLKQKGQHSVSVTKAGEEGQPDKKGKITFKYDFKNSPSSPEAPRKQTVKPTEPPKKEKEKEKQKEKEKEKQKQKEAVPERNESHADLESARNKKNSLPSQAELEEDFNNNRSRQTINLPSIVTSNYNQVYGDRIFDKQSAATLQKSIVAYSVPKAGRFGSDPKYSGEPSYCLDSCFRKNVTKGAGFGFGRKKQFPDWMQRNMKENPAPGAYFQADYDLNNRGPTFGLSHKHYEKVIIPKQKRPIHQVARSTYIPNPELSPIHK